MFAVNIIFVDSIKVQLIKFHPVPTSKTSSWKDSCTL